MDEQIEYRVVFIDDKGEEWPDEPYLSLTSACEHADSRLDMNWTGRIEQRTVTYSSWIEVPLV